ncbi:syncytin-2-like [Apodemus sylvaticus]|uniref:syncytin-2-like n=1 Tax=Apodemus sylvaticus TaxID=10129 RepID=UPI0022448DDA|nr:syncytin-2-like [Apodemus sylvaticus]
MIAARRERAVQIVPLLVATGIAIGVGTGVAEITASLAQYNTFTSQFKSDRQGMTETVLTIQKQIDSLAAVVLQNRRGLDVLTAKEGGLCLFLQEECCFYVNQSGIVRNKIQELQTDIKNFRDRETSSSDIFENPIWKWILPLLLLQNSQPQPMEEPPSPDVADANMHQVDPDDESQLHPKIDNTPRQQEVV